MPSSIFNMTISQTQNIPILIGSTSSFNVTIQNTSSTKRLYNLGIALTLPDGLTLSSSTIPQTSSTTNADNSTTYSFVNIKDLAPLETPYIFTITIKCNTKFKNGNAIPFGYNFSGITVYSYVDTMPRGIYDIGNEVLTSTISMTYITTRFNSTIVTSGKVLKGAGTSINLNDYSQVTTATCKFFNNSLSASFVNITILLDDGIRYIGNISVSGTDSSQFNSPTVSYVNKDGKLYTQLYFGNINLSINSNTTFIFSYAVWNRYNNNTSNLINHGTVLNMNISMVSNDPLLIASSTSSTNFSAMDLIITTSINKSTVDVQTNVTYTYVYKVGGYYNIQNIIVNYFLPDGIYYLSSSVIPNSIVDNPTLKGFYLTYNFPLASINSIKTVTISAKVDSYYRYKFDSLTLNSPVVAFDPFLAKTDITGTLDTLLVNVSDNSSVSSSIAIGNITKEFLKGYYKDGSPKTITALAPGDLAEYLLTYNASTLKAIQKSVFIDDFFPLSTNPIDNLNYSFTGVMPVNTTPNLISPHGVDFNYGDILGLSTGTINVKVPIATLGSSTQNANLLKLKGINTYGVAYSNRTQVNVNIGTPNLTLTKTVSGPNKSAIKANEVYTYTVTISNSNSSSETDAFDFTLNDTLSQSWFTLNVGSISVTGTGTFTPPIVQGNNIVLYIKKLSPGKSLTLTYTVTISSVIAPNVSILTTATTTNPYSQVYNESTTNFQYSNLNKSASTTISSANISLTKTNYSDTFKVGSNITYTLTVEVPLGTIAYNLYLKDTLPSGGQSYVGPSYKNGALVTPTISSNNVTFQTEPIIDSRTSIQTLTYIFTSKITNATKALNSISSTQTNTVTCYYGQVASGPYFSLNKNLIITVNHPNLVMSLSATDLTTQTQYTSTANINLNSIMQFKLIMKNNSLINLVNGTIEIPINDNFVFSSIDNSILCSGIYNSTLKKLIVNISSLSPSSLAYITFTLIPKPNSKSGTTMITQATATSYYNDVTVSKVYGGETSNPITCTLGPSVSLLPDPIYQINPTTSFIVTPPGNTALILDYFKNTGGGYDDFTLIIQKVSIPYSLYIDDVKVSDVLANTLYQADLQAMANLAPNTSKVIKITALIPINSLGVRYDFTVTAKSKTSPYPESTVLNIDPNPF